MGNYINNELLVIITNYSCSLKCKNCAIFIPQAPSEAKKYFVHPEQLKNDLANLSKILRTNRIQIQGGESTLHKELDSIIDIVTASGISDNIQLVTNATNILNENVISSLKKNKTNVRISNYKIAKQNIPSYEKQLMLNSIPYEVYKYVDEDEFWFDMGEYQAKRNGNDTEVNEIFKNCPFKVCWTLFDGYLTKCSRSASSYVAGHHELFHEDFINVGNPNLDELRSNLVRWDENKFLESCRYCKGISGKKINPGIQLDLEKTSIIKKEQNTTLKIAFYYTLSFQLRVLKQIEKEFEYTLLSDSMEEIEEWIPNVIFTADAAQIPNLRNFCDLNDVKLIGLRHGVANKYIPTDPEYALANYVCGSKWDRRDFNSANVIPLEGFLTTGNPWIDGVFKIQKRKLDENNPTILFAPTYNPEVSAAFFFEGEIVNLIRLVFPKSKIIIKLHPAILDYNNKYVSQYKNMFIDLVESFDIVSENDRNVLFVKNNEVAISDFYSESDILISDGSSLIFEFMALNRPILLYTNEKKVEMWSSIYDDNSISNSKRNVGAEFKTKQEFLYVLKNAFISHQNVHSRFQKSYCEEMFGDFTDGMSSKRVADAVKNIFTSPNSAKLREGFRNRKLNRSEELIELGRYEEAKELLLSLLQTESLNIDALNNLAVIYILETEFENAISLINKILTIDSTNGIALENLQYINENFEVSKINKQNNVNGITKDSNEKLLKTKKVENSNN